ncbi:29610_t:CDS:2, partial [Racocetra persica]
SEQQLAEEKLQANVEIPTSNKNMANNQIEFNNEYNKETKEIKIETEDFAEEQLIIKDYPNLEKLYFLKELVIENCPQIKVLNVRQNNLANLEFLKGLGNLETLEIDGNPELIKMLEPYRKIIQKSNEN